MLFQIPIRFVTGASLLASALIVVSVCGAQTETKPMPATPIIAQPPAGANATHDCPKLIEFSGEQADSSDLKIPAVSGRVLIYYWSELEPEEGKFDFANMDKEISLWTNAGKLVVLRFSVSGQTHWKKPWSIQGTPAWAYRKYHIGSVTEVDGAILPVYWNQGFLTDLDLFLHGLSAHIQASPYRDKVTFIELAVGDGGETKPDTEQNKTPEERAARLELWQKVGYTNALWYQAIAKTIEIYKKEFPSIPLALMPDGTFLGGDCDLPNNQECREKTIVALANQNGLVLQDNGFDRAKIYSAEWHNKPLVCEQFQSATKAGYPLQDDLAQSIKAACAWMLVFRQDLKRPDFQQQVTDFYSHCSIVH